MKISVDELYANGSLTEPINHTTFKHLDLAVLVRDTLPSLTVVRILYNIFGDKLSRPAAALHRDGVHLKAAAQVYREKLRVRALLRTPRRIPYDRVNKEKLVSRKSHRH